MDGHTTSDWQTIVNCLVKSEALLVFGLVTDNHFCVGYDSAHLPIRDTETQTEYQILLIGMDHFLTVQIPVWRSEFGSLKSARAKRDELQTQINKLYQTCTVRIFSHLIVRTENLGVWVTAIWSLPLPTHTSIGVEQLALSISHMIKEGREWLEDQTD